MGNFWKYLFSFLLIVVLGLQAFTVLTLFKEKKETKIVKVATKPKEWYSLSLKSDLDFLEYLNSKGYRYSYTDGKVFLILENKKSVEEILKHYRDYLKKKLLLRSATLAVVKLLEESIEETEKEKRKTFEDFKSLNQIFTERGVNVGFGIFKSDILELQKKTYELYKRYWLKKREQILKGYTFEVDEPKINTASLLKRAANYFEDNLKLRLFSLYLKLKILEAKLTAEYSIYGELKNGSQS